MAAPIPSSSRPLRVTLQSHSLPKYRNPVWEELARRPGMDLTIVYGNAPDGPPSVAPTGFRARCVPQRRLQLPGRTVLWHAPQWEEATRANADVIVFNWNLNYASLVPGLLRARANGLGTVLWGHGYSANEAVWRELPRRAVSELAHALLFYAEPAAAEYRARTAAPERIFVAANALDQREIQAARDPWLVAPERLAAFRREQGIDSGPVLLFVARLDVGKRVDLLLRAAAQLRGELPGLRVLIVGSGAEERSSRELAESLGLGSAVHFLGAIYDEKDLAPFFLSSDLFVMPSAVGLSILHAFGYGLPVVTHAERRRHGPEIAALRDGENGLLFGPPGDLNALVGTLRTTLSNPDRIRTMARAAHRTATEEFTVARMNDGTEQAIHFAAAAARR